MTASPAVARSGGRADRRAVTGTEKLRLTRKRQRRDLAIHGSRPEFDSPLHVGRPYMGNRERLLDRYSAALDRSWVTNNGPLVQELEAKLAARIGIEHFVAVCNGSLALQLCLRALGLDGEVILPAFTFVATAHAVAWEGLVPVFADISRETHCVDPGWVEGLVNRRTSAVIGVHLWGRACDVEGLAAIARRHGTRLIFDAAHAFACTHRGRPIGGFGDAEIFSFHATKFFHTLEGGGVATNDAALAGALRRLRNHGFTGVDEVAGLSRDALVDVLRAENVLARRYFFPGCHRFEPYRSRGRLTGRPLPGTDHVASRVVCLPTGPTVSEADIDTIAEIIRAACAE